MLPGKTSNTPVELRESKFFKRHLLMKYLHMDYLLSLQVMQLLERETVSAPQPGVNCFLGGLCSKQIQT